MNDTTGTCPFSPKILHLSETETEIAAGGVRYAFPFHRSAKAVSAEANHVFSHLEFEDTPIEDWLKMQDALGLTRGLHVQSMMYENNYEIALHGQCRFPDRLRAVVIPGRASPRASSTFLPRPVRSATASPTGS